jgi:tRNA threonylcarbamoyladenosine biosynthesis protein TsaB
VPASSEPRFLILETSGRVGQVAVAQGAAVLKVRHLDEARRHARDLAPAVAELLAGQGWKPRDLNAVLVSRGPGSYTGLRVGTMSAKALVYAAGCALITIDTCAAIALQAPAEAQMLDVLADAQQDKLYVQHFTRTSASELTIVSAAEWLARRDSTAWVTGPGVSVVAGRLPAGTPIVETALREPQVESLAGMGAERFQAQQFDDVWTLEPLYARPSSAEEKWQR